MHPSAPLRPARQPRIDDLQQQIRRWERGGVAQAGAVRSTGCGALDDLLPDRGVRPGSLVEWLGTGAAAGAGTLSLLAGWQVRAAGRPLIVVDAQRRVFPPALAAWGLDVSQLVIVRPRSAQEALWACEEALRCTGVGLVWAELEQLTSTAFRRLQLAAEASGGIGFLVRPERARHQPSWAAARLVVSPRPGVVPPQSLPFVESVSGRAASRLLRGRCPCFVVEAVYGQGRATRSTAQVLLDRVAPEATDAVSADHFRGAIHEVPDSAHADALPLVS